MNAVEQFNQGVFLIINARPNPEMWMLNLARFLAHYASYAIPIILLYAWLYGERSARGRVVMHLAIRSRLLSDTSGHAQSNAV